MARAKKTQEKAPEPTAPASEEDIDISDAVVVSPSEVVSGHDAEGPENAAQAEPAPQITAEQPQEATAPSSAPEVAEIPEPPAVPEAEKAPEPERPVGPTSAELDAMQAKQNAYAAQLRFDRLATQHPELSFFVDRMKALEKENADLKARLGIK